MSDDGARTPGPGEPELVYQRFQAVFGGRRTSLRRSAAAVDGASEPFQAGRDPRSLVAALGDLARQFGWESSIAKADLLGRWPEIAGEETARHTDPVGIEDAVLVVRCDSTAWATQLRRMQSHLVTSIRDAFPASRIESIRFLGPDVPSWKHGRYTVQGRGPRDTYG